MKTKTLLVIAALNAFVSGIVACAASSGDDTQSGGADISAVDVAARARTFHTTPTDRIGRPALSAVVLNMTAEVGEKDSARTAHVKWFDELDSFSGSDAEGSKESRIIDEITNGLHLMDHSDGKDDFTDAELASWVALFKEDALVVDVSKPCGVDPDPSIADLDSSHSYLDIEKEMVDGDHTHRTCGGRTPKDDTVDVFMTFAITHRDWHPGARDWKTSPEHIGDLIDNASAATNTFPYLATPHPISIPAVPIADDVDLGMAPLVAGDFSEVIDESGKAVAGDALKAIWNKVLALVAGT
jgi:hypothetical protein